MPQPALDTHAEVRTLKQAGCPEEQAEAMVDLVSRAPLKAQIPRSLEKVELRLDSIEGRMSDMATQSALDALALRVESIELRMATKADLENVVSQVQFEARMAEVATKSDLDVLRAETKAGLEGLRAEMNRMFWIQGGVLATLILGLATIMVGLDL